MTDSIKHMQADYFYNPYAHFKYGINTQLQDAKEFVGGLTPKDGPKGLPTQPPPPITTEPANTTFQPLDTRRKDLADKKKMTTATLLTNAATGDASLGG